MNLSELKATIAAATDDDNADLGETIGFMAVFLPLKQGFTVSDQDHAEQISGWLCELSQFRTALPHALQVVEEMAKAVKMARLNYQEQADSRNANGFIVPWTEELTTADDLAEQALTAYERFQIDVMGEK